MKKLTFYGLLGIFLIAIITVIVVLTSKNPTFDDDNGTIPYFREEPEYIYGLVGSGTINDFYKTTGVVVSKSEDLNTLVISVTDLDDFNLVKDIGFKFEINETIYIKNGVEYKSTTSGKVIDIIYNNDEVEILYLDYKNQFIETSIRLEDEDKININTEVEVIFEDEIIQGKIKYIDYKVTNGLIKIEIECDKGFLIGSSIDISFIKDTKENAVIVHKQFVTFDGNATYVEIMDDENKPIKVYIEPGINNGEYIEILQGDISSGQKVVRIKNNFMGTTE